MMYRLKYTQTVFPIHFKEWKHLSEESKRKPSVQSFKKYLNDFKRPAGNSVFAIRDKFGIKLLTKIRVNFSDLRDHRFNHSFNCGTLFALVVLKMKHLFISFYTVLISQLSGQYLLAKYQIELAPTYQSSLTNIYMV